MTIAVGLPPLVVGRHPRMLPLATVEFVIGRAFIACADAEQRAEGQTWQEKSSRNTDISIFTKMLDGSKQPQTIG